MTSPPDIHTPSTAKPSRLARLRQLPPRHKIAGGILLALALGAASVAAAMGTGVVPGTLKGKVQRAFPNTPITSVQCGMIGNLCEVTAGPNVFYVTRDGRYAMVGSLLDLKQRLDLTDRRLKELAAVDSVASRLGGTTGAATAPAGTTATATGAPTVPAAKIDITLPTTNAIVHNRGGALKLAAFTDLNCSYCKMMIESLSAAPDIELTEYPMELLRPDSADKAKLALCATDRARSAEALYSGGEVRVTGDCAAALAAVEANTQFAKAHGVTGTPTLVRLDGTTNPGFMPVDQLRTWIKAAG